MKKKLQHQVAFSFLYCGCLMDGFLLEQTVVKCYHHAAFPVAFMTAESYVLQPLGCRNRHCAAAGYLNALLSI